MLREMTTGAEAGVRITTSQLWEALSSLSIIARYPDRVPWPYTRWATHARRVLATSPAVAPLRLLYQRRTALWPNLIRPVPPPPGMTIKKELSALCATDPRLLQAWSAALTAGNVSPRVEVPGRPGQVGPIRAAEPGKNRREPAETMARVCEGLLAYWEEALAPYWFRMRIILEEEVLYRAETLATEGPRALVSRICEPARSARPHPTADRLRPPHRGRVYVLPLVFLMDGPLCTTDAAGNLVIAYQARGAAALAEQTTAGGGHTSGLPVQDNRLSMLLGRGRSTILQLLKVPSTTAGLATQLSLAPSTVSEHLTGLAAAGVVRRRRVGRRVLYELNTAGNTLVHLLADAEINSIAAERVV